MATPYLTLDSFSARTLMAPSEVSYVESDSPGFVDARISIRTSWLHQRLRKRYGRSLPFAAPVPEIVLGWIVAMVTLDVMRRRGFNPQDSVGAMFIADAERAETEVKEAADSKEGLFDIGTNDADGAASNVSTGGPLGYSETSPYVWTSKQRRQGTAEDRAHDGSGDD